LVSSTVNNSAAAGSATSAKRLPATIRTRAVVFIPVFLSRLLRMCLSANY